MNKPHIHVLLSSGFYFCSSFSFLFFASQPAGGATVCFILVQYRTAPALLYSWRAFQYNVYWLTISSNPPHLFDISQNQDISLNEENKKGFKANHLWFIARQCHAWQRTGLLANKQKGQSNFLYCDKMIGILISLTIHWFDFLINSFIYIYSK